MGPHSIAYEALEADDALAADREETKVEPRCPYENPNCKCTDAAHQALLAKPLPPTAERPPEAAEPFEASEAFRAWVIAHPIPFKPSIRDAFEAGKASEAAAHAETRRMFDVTRHRVLKALAHEDMGKGWHWIESEVAASRKRLLAYERIVAGADAEDMVVAAKARIIELEAELERVRAELASSQRVGFRLRANVDVVEEARDQLGARDDEPNTAFLRRIVAEFSALREGREEPTARELGQKLQAAASEFNGRSAVVGNRAQAYWDELGGCAKRELLGVRPRVPVVQTRDEVAQFVVDMMVEVTGCDAGAVSGYPIADALLARVGVRPRVPTLEQVEGVLWEFSGYAAPLAELSKEPRARIRAMADALLRLFTGPAVDGKDSGPLQPKDPVVRGSDVRPGADAGAPADHVISHTSDPKAENRAAKVPASETRETPTPATALETQAASPLPEPPCGGLTGTELDAGWNYDAPPDSEIGQTHELLDSEHAIDIDRQMPIGEMTEHRCDAKGCTVCAMWRAPGGRQMRAMGYSYSVKAWRRAQQQPAATPAPTLESLDARLREVELQGRVTRRLAQLPYGDPAHEHFTNAAERIEREERETAK